MIVREEERKMSFKLTWYGHAALALETGGYKILVDPFLSGNPMAPVSADRVEADFILLSHGHGDHVGDTIEIAKRTGAMVISNFEIAGWCEEKGTKAHGQHLGGGYQHPFGYLKFTLALHGSGLPDGKYGGNPAGFLLTTNDKKKIYLAGDTGLFGDMRLIGEEGLDLAVIPIGDNFTMGPDDALRAVKFLTPKNVIPIHSNSWAQRVAAETQAKVEVLKPGESFTLP
jgi:L-ascorbate metabolism protein UlaG (beta-lactamase superfamily)